MCHRIRCCIPALQSSHAGRLCRVLAPLGRMTLAIMLEERKPLIIDARAHPGVSSVPGAIGLWVSALAAASPTQYQGRLESKVQELTHGDQLPVVVMGWNAERYQGRNLGSRSVTRTFTGTAGVMRRVK